MSSLDRKAHLRQAFIHFANLATDVAHDVASPLQVMTGYLEHLQTLLKSPHLDRNALERVHSKFHHSLERFKKTINGLTTERQRTHEGLESIQIEVFTKRAIKIMLPTLRTWNVIVDFKSNDDESVREIDPAKYSDLLLDLFGDWIAQWKIKSLSHLEVSITLDEKGIILGFGSKVLLPNPPTISWLGKQISFDKTKRGWQVHLLCPKKQKESKSAA
jgi:hypothetical protein